MHLQSKHDGKNNQHTAGDLGALRPHLMLLTATATADAYEVNGHENEETDDGQERDACPNYDSLDNYKEKALLHRGPRYGKVQSVKLAFFTSK